MSFIAPMYARPLPDNFSMKTGEWSAEEKFDGHRLIMEISDGASSLFAAKTIRAWSRYGLPRILPIHITEAACVLPNCILDGELRVPGKRSYGVTELVNSPDLVYSVFDVIEIDGTTVTDAVLATRRECLQTLFQSAIFPAIQIAPWRPVDTWEEVVAYRDEVWKRDGEGLILKRYDSIYEPGKRPKSWAKIKDLKYEVMTIIGWAEGRGTKDYRGKHAMVLLVDDEGVRATVKTLNNAILQKLDKIAADTGKPPLIGRKLCIKYQETTPEGYRHPRWWKLEGDPL